MRTEIKIILFYNNDSNNSNNINCQTIYICENSGDFQLPRLSEPKVYSLYMYVKHTLTRHLCISIVSHTLMVPAFSGIPARQMK